MSRPRATLKIMDLPTFGRAARRFEVDCPASTTGLTHLPTPALGLSDEVLILAAGYAHEERCGECDVGDVLGRGDQGVRGLTERTWAAVRERLMDGRRN
jgi:hypothetical protein